MDIILMVNYILILTLIIVFTRLLFYKWFLEFYKYLNIRKSGIKTIGEIVDFSDNIDYEGTKSYIPIIEYYDINGNRYVRMFEEISSLLKPQIKTKILVVYPKNEPNNAIICNNKALVSYGLKFLFALIGLSISILFILNYMNLL